MADVRQTLEAWRQLPLVDDVAPDAGATDAPQDGEGVVPHFALKRALQYGASRPAHIPSHVPPEQMEPI